MSLNLFTVSTDLLNILVKYAREKGEGISLDLRLVQADAARVPMPDFGRALAQVQMESGDNDFGLHFGEYCGRMLSRHLLFAMMMNCRSVGQAIEKNFQYHNLIMDMISPQMKTSKSDACLTWEVHHPAIESDRHFSESIMAIQTSMLQILTEDTVKLTEARFSHDRPKQTAEHRRIFRTELKFNCARNELRFSKTALDAAVIFGNPSILAGLEQLVKEQLHSLYSEHVYTKKISRVLSKKLLAGERTSIETVAGDLAMSSRTLQLKLKSENTSFRQILDEVRKGLAIAALRDMDTTICEVALMLEFSDQSAFHNAFKRWTGQTPGQYRKKAYTNT